MILTFMINKLFGLLPKARGDAIRLLILFNQLSKNPKIFSFLSHNAKKSGKSFKIQRLELENRVWKAT